ncbi:MAG: hypothetical protein J7559_12290 [Cohnella sp.]|nr:hypothetical protein [Cohnella sp.]
MAGIIQDNMIFPILELIRNEIRKNNQFINQATATSDPFEGNPSIQLYRDHPLDLDKITGARLMYPSGYTQDVFMFFGTEEADPGRSDYDYIRSWLLRSVRLHSMDTDGGLIESLHIRLNYDHDWRLTGTSVSRID